MTLLAIWHRKDQNDLYAIADSRLTAPRNGVLTNHAPKFALSQIICHGVTSKNTYDGKIYNKPIVVGYTGSSSVAFATIATLQSYLASICLNNKNQLPSLSEIALFSRNLLKNNWRDFGSLWQDVARCDLVLFGYSPFEENLQAFHLQTILNKNDADVEVKKLNLTDPQGIACFGSGSSYFVEKLKEDMEKTGNFHPFNILSRIIEGSERSDIGGAVQVAIASREGAILPHVVTPRLDRGEFAADVTFLGRDVTEIGPIGECSVGLQAVGPDLAALLKLRKKAGY